MYESLTKLVKSAARKAARLEAVGSALESKSKRLDLAVKLETNLDSRVFVLPCEVGGVARHAHACNARPPAALRAGDPLLALEAASSGLGRYFAGGDSRH